MVDVSISPRPTWRTPGLLMVIPMAVLQGVNVVRVIFNPVGFAAYMGAPLASPIDVAWVQIYGLRTAFIAALLTIFLIRRDHVGLKWTALAGILMPLGDAWVAHHSGAGIATVGRHLAIGVYIVLTWLALRAANRRLGSGDSV